MRSGWKKLFCMIGIVAGSAIMATVMLALCFLLPVSQKRYSESQTVFDEEGWYPFILNLGSGNSFQSNLPGVLDNSSDYIMFTTALDDSAQWNVLDRAMRMHSSYAGDYSYYWHGYVAVLRPLFLVFNYGELRYLNAICQILLVLYLAILLSRQKGNVGVLLLATSYVLLMPVSLMYSFQYSWVFYIAMISAAFLLKNRNRMEKNDRFLYVFLLSGILTAFMDLLTYPLFTWGFPILFWLYTSGEKKTTGHLRDVVCSALSWILGYGGMWAMKWVLADLILKGNVLQAARAEVGLRSGASDQATFHMLLEAVRNNWNTYSYKVLMMVLAAWIVFFLVRFLQNGLTADSRYPAFLLVGVSSLVWYMALSEHTRLHHMFTYRIFQMSILASFMIYDIATCRKNTLKQGMGRRFLALLLLGGLSVIPLFFCVEEHSFFNGSGVAGEVQLVSGESVEFRFTPQYEYLTQVLFEFDAGGTEGELEITLSDESGTVLRKKRLQLSRYPKKAMYGVEMDIHLHTGKEYWMSYKVLEAEESVSLSLLLPGENTDIEMQHGAIIKGENAPDTHPLIRFNYEVKTFPAGRKFVFCLISSMLVLCALLPSCRYLGHKEFVKKK